MALGLSSKFQDAFINNQFKHFLISFVKTFFDLWVISKGNWLISKFGGFSKYLFIINFYHNSIMIRVHTHNFNPLIFVENCFIAQSILDNVSCTPEKNVYFEVQCYVC